jgi:hypothetical protein
MRKRNYASINNCLHACIRSDMMESLASEHKRTHELKLTSLELMQVKQGRLGEAETWIWRFGTEEDLQAPRLIEHGIEVFCRGKIADSQT